MIHADTIPGLAIGDNQTRLIGESYFFVNDVLVAGLMSLLTILSFRASSYTEFNDSVPILAGKVILGVHSFDDIVNSGL